MATVYGLNIGKFVQQYIEKEDRVLEIGTGSGRITKLLSKKAGFVVTCDSNPYLKPELLRDLPLSVIFLPVSIYVNNQDVPLFLNFNHTKASILENPVDFKTVSDAVYTTGLDIRTVLEIFRINSLVVDVSGSEFELVNRAVAVSSLKKMIIQWYPIRPGLRMMNDQFLFRNGFKVDDFSKQKNSLEMSYYVRS